MKTSLSIEEREAIKASLTERERLPGKDTFLDAVFFPWNDPPIGLKVVDDQGRVGEVVGCNGATKAPHCECPTCSCPKVIEPMAGWWLIKRPALGTILFVWYPPSLKPYQETNV